jgi:membrane metallo-endopeptidase-like protein 1
MMQDQLDNTLISRICYSFSLFIFLFLADLLSSVPLNSTAEPKAITNVRRLYASCVNEAAIEMKSVDTILTFINTELGGWPVLQGSTWNNSVFNFSSLLIKLHEYNTNIIYRINTKIDILNSSVHCIRVR